VCNLMGLEFTPASKGAWTYSTRPLSECTFLKRGFTTHHLLGLVAPLEIRTITSTLNFVSDNFRNEELTLMKVQNFQREAFLHQYRYEDLLKILANKLRSVGLPFHRLPESYLVNLYFSGDYIEDLPMH
jgi:hypothetical protein